MTRNQIYKMLLLIDIFDIHDEVYWNAALLNPKLDSDNDPLFNEDGFYIKFHIICNDVFLWASADMEPVETDEDMALLEKSIKDCEHLMDYSGTMLYCCRRRGQRPQGAFYQYVEKEARHLFDECGPARKVCFGNPIDRGELKL